MFLIKMPLQIIVLHYNIMYYGERINGLLIVTCVYRNFRFDSMCQQLNKIPYTCYDILETSTVDS